MAIEIEIAECMLSEIGKKTHNSSELELYRDKNWKSVSVICYSREIATRDSKQESRVRRNKGESLIYDGSRTQEGRTVERRIRSRQMMELVYSSVCGKTMGDATYTHDKYGAPWIQDNGYSCSVSYTRERIATIVAKAERTGIDIEDANRFEEETRGCLEIFEKTVKPFVSAIPDLGEIRDPCTLWVSIEAVLKMLGRGFRISIEDIKETDLRAKLNLAKIDSTTQVAIAYQIK